MNTKSLLQLLQEGAPVRCLSIRQPWAWLIVNGYKDLENRTRPWAYRGPLLIHAAQRETPGDWHVAADIQWRANRTYVPMDGLEHGGFVGIANLTGCVTQSDSPWFFGPYGFLMEQARPLSFIPFKGRLGLWSPDSATLEAVMEQLKGAA